MKKIYGLLVLASLAVAGCQKDTAINKPAEQEKVAVSFTAKLPANMVTQGSADGGIVGNNVDFTNDCSLRYIMCVFDNSNNPVLNETIITSDPAIPVLFNVRLVPATYKVAFWADIITKTSYVADKYYNTDALSSNGTISLYGSELSYLFTGSSVNTEERDAYAFAKTIDLTASGITDNITLKRPFAKIRLVATGQASDLLAIGKTVNVEGLKVPKTYNILNGTSSGEVTLMYSAINTYNDHSNGEQTLFSDYVLPPSSGKIECKITVSGYTEYTASNIPVELNKLTTIKGNFNIP